jgi:pimeloyl-ACP methyl ester carboxylesterase
LRLSIARHPINDIFNISGRNQMWITRRNLIDLSRCSNWPILFMLLLSPSTAQQLPVNIPAPPGTLVDIGGQRLHLNCTGTGTPTVLLESGTGDISVIWSLVQPGVSALTRVCSYDRGGYAWSEPGTRPRTFAQLALELHTALEKMHIGPPYVLVGQSYGGFVVRGFAARYAGEVSGMVLVDAIHEDQRIVYGGQPHRIIDSAKGLPFPAPKIGLDPGMPPLTTTGATGAPEQALEEPLDRLPKEAQRVWRWAQTQPLLDASRSAELDWSPEELAVFHRARLKKRTSLGDIPLIVLARAQGGFVNGMSVSAADLEKERHDLQADLAHLSSKGRLIYAANAGHNIHLEDPELVIRSIREVLLSTRRTYKGKRQ